MVDAASVGAGLWFSYLFVLLYLFIAVGSVTHRDLFLQSPVRLPFLDVDLPLLGFFVLGPAIFLIVHAYVLLHFVLLAGKVGDFDAELRVQITDEEVEQTIDVGGFPVFSIRAPQRPRLSCALSNFEKIIAWQVVSFESGLMYNK